MVAALGSIAASPGSISRLLKVTTWKFAQTRLLLSALSAPTWHVKWSCRSLLEWNIGLIFHISWFTKGSKITLLSTQRKRVLTNISDTTCLVVEQPYCHRLSELDMSIQALSFYYTCNYQFLITKGTDKIDDFDSSNFLK